jgi:hypothetical protein
MINNIYVKVGVVVLALALGYVVGTKHAHPAPLALPHIAPVATAAAHPHQAPIVAILAKLSVQDRAVIVKALTARRAALWQPTPRIAFHPLAAKHVKAAHHTTAKAKKHKKHKTKAKSS